MWPALKAGKAGAWLRAPESGAGGWAEPWFRLCAARLGPSASRPPWRPLKIPLPGPFSPGRGRPGPGPLSAGRRRAWSERGVRPLGGELAAQGRRAAAAGRGGAAPAGGAAAPRPAQVGLQAGARPSSYHSSLASL